MASASPTTSSARATRRSSCSPRGRSSTRASGRRRSRTWPATFASWRSTRAATAARTGRNRRRLRPAHARARRAGVLDAAGIDHCVMVVHCGSARPDCCSRRPPRPLSRRDLLLAGLPISPPLPARDGHSFDAELDVLRGLGEGQPALLGAGLPRLPRVLLGRASPSRTDEADRGLDQLGAGHRPRDARSTRSTAPECPRRDLDDLLGRIHFPCSSSTATRTARAARSRRGVRRPHRRRADRARGRRPPSRRRATRSLINHRCATSPSAPTSGRRRRRAGGGRSAGPGGAVLSSPIGLGHAWRDVAIARELRRLHPGPQIDWLAQDPVTRVLEACGETHPSRPARCSPTSRATSPPSRAGTSSTCSRRWRRMDEILWPTSWSSTTSCATTTTTCGSATRPGSSTTTCTRTRSSSARPYCFLTDFVGWLPLPEGGADEARLTADYNAEMIEQIARFPRVRDRAIFVGKPADIVPHDFGDGLPAIRPWVEEHFDFSGYVLAPAPARDARRAGRARLRPDERVCLVTVGGSGVGGGLLQRVIDAYPRRPRDPTCAWSWSAGRGSTRRRCRRPTASRSCRTCTSSRGSWLRATSRSPRVG